MLKRSWISVAARRASAQADSSDSNWNGFFRFKNKQQYYYEFVRRRKLSQSGGALDATSHIVQNVSLGLSQALRFYGNTGSSKTLGDAQSGVNTQLTLPASQARNGAAEYKVHRGEVNGFHLEATSAQELTGTPEGIFVLSPAPGVGSPRKTPLYRWYDAGNFNNDFP